MVDLLDYMEKRVKNDSYYSYSHPKMVIQGGHDTTINLIQLFMFTAFNIPVKYVKFGAHIYFELHKDDSDKHSGNVSIILISIITIIAGFLIITILYSLYK